MTLKCMKYNATNIIFYNIYSSLLLHFYNMNLNNYKNISNITSSRMITSNTSKATKKIVLYKSGDTQSKIIHFLLIRNVS
jgi:hypothetical protein